MIRFAINAEFVPARTIEEWRAIGIDGFASSHDSSADIVLSQGGFGADHAQIGLRQAIELAHSITEASDDALDEAIAGSRVIHRPIVELPDVGTHLRATSISPVEIGDWLVPLVDEAAEVGVTLAVVNGSAIRTAAMMWHLLERVAHPALACCWDVEAAARWGEEPGVSVPTLGSRIISVRVGSLGDRTHKFINRLRGIGFDGWMTITNPAIADEASLSKLREWIVAGKADKALVAKKGK
ncbi:MAG: hypothetical protein JO353_05770 [Phycisphaerae bacterium]|nr:hypothetical protein [Phycisphaerae bacterium]